MNREEIEEALVDYWEEQMDLDELVEYFREHKLDYLLDLWDRELKELAAEAGIIIDDDDDEE